jgi:SOS-response transcriptional repressor LexA
MQFLPDIPPNERHVSEASEGPEASVGASLRARREELRWSLQRVADAVGCTKSYLCEVELGKRSVPSDEVLGKLEATLRVPLGTWVRKASWERSLHAGGSVVRSELRELFGKPSGELLRGLRKVVGADVTRAAGDVDDGHAPRAAARGDVLPLSATLSATLGASAGVDIPIINKVPAGQATEFTDLGYPARTADAFMRCPGVTDPDAFAARVIGDSMEPTYLEGDVVVFSPAAQVVDGCDCFARLEPDQECTFKRVYVEDGGARIRLQPLNAKYAARTLDREQIAGLYVAVRVLREIGLRVNRPSTLQ